MGYLILGFITGLSLIFAIGAQNIFVIEQGLKKEYIFLVCSICAISDFILIFFGIFLFSFFDNFFSLRIEFILNILLFIFLIHFIWNKIKTYKNNIVITKNYKKYSFLKIIYKTLGFTYLNPHVYSDTVFFLGNFSKNFLIHQKYLFAIGASVASLIFFFSLGYLSNYLSNYLIKKKIWKIVNLIIILFMFFLVLFVLKNIFIFII